MMSIIRKMTPSDLNEVKAIEDLSFPDPWTREQLLSEMGHIAFTALEQQVSGYLFARRILDEVEILSLAVRPDSRKRGIGRLLLSELRQFAVNEGIKALFLEVRISNTPAIRLYESAGFKRMGIRKKYYQDNEDALTLCSSL